MRSPRVEVSSLGLAYCVVTFGESGLFEKMIMNQRAQRHPHTAAARAGARTHHTRREQTEMVEVRSIPFRRHAIVARFTSPSARTSCNIPAHAPSCNAPMPAARHSTAQNNTAMLVPETNTRVRCTGDDESAPYLLTLRLFSLLLPVDLSRYGYILQCVPLSIGQVGAGPQGAGHHPRAKWQPATDQRTWDHKHRASPALRQG